MGQFSWYFSDTNKQLVNNKRTDAYLLVPPPFQSKYGKAICERCYDGYGHFGNYDIYDLVAEWNREFLSEDMLRDKPVLENYGGLYDFEKKELLEQGFSEEDIKVKDLVEKQANFERGIKRYNYDLQKLLDYKFKLSNEEMLRKYGKYWKHELGVAIACGDEQNIKLPYPIKITTKEMPYDKATFSKRDPNQGWEY